MDRAAAVRVFPSRLKRQGNSEKGSAKNDEEHEADQNGTAAPTLASLVRGDAGVVFGRRRGWG
jgi:hypothetical protein